MRDIQFGKSNIVTNSLSGTSYKKGNIYCSPAIQVTYKAFPTVECKIDPLHKVNPFSNGSEFDCWHTYNCENCSREFCALRERLMIAYLDDGKIPFKTARRIGINRIAVQSNGFTCVDLGDCKEQIK